MGRSRQAIAAQSKIWEELEPQLARRSYELEIARRLLVQGARRGSRQIWQTQVDVSETLADMTEGDLAEQQEEVALCEAMVAEIEADLGRERFDGVIQPESLPGDVSRLGQGIRSKSGSKLAMTGISRSRQPTRSAHHGSSEHR